MSNEGYGFKEVSNLIETIQNYRVDHLEVQYQSLGSRFSVINQTIRADENSVERIRLNKITTQMTLLETHYIELGNNSTVEKKANVLALVSDINKQIEKLEGRAGEHSGN